MFAKEAAAVSVADLSGRAGQHHSVNHASLKDAYRHRARPPRGPLEIRDREMAMVKANVAQALN